MLDQLDAPQRIDDRALRQAVAAGRSRWWIATQATTTAVLDPLVAKETQLYGLINTLPELFDEDATPLVEMRLALILQSLPRAYTAFYASRGDPVPMSYSRHASVHALSDDQFTQVNALFALLLTVSLIRELHEFGDDEVAVQEVIIRADRNRE